MPSFNLARVFNHSLYDKRAKNKIFKYPFSGLLSELEKSLIFILYMHMGCYLCVCLGLAQAHATRNILTLTFKMFQAKN